MDYKTINQLNKARIYLANRNFDQLYKICKEIPYNALKGNVFDRDCEINKDTIPLIIEEARRKRGIKEIDKKDLKNLSKTSFRASSMGESELNNIFYTMESNLELFENKFENKIYKIDTFQQKSILVSIEMCSLFHLLGFNFIEWQKNHKDFINKLFPEFENLMSRNYKEICRSNDRSLYDALHNIIDKKDEIIYKTMANNKAMDTVMNMKKVKIKNFLFQRSVFTSSPSGVIHNTPKEGYIKGDFYLIRDFINNTNIEWDCLSFKNYGSNPHRSCESLLFNYFDRNDINSRNKDYTKSIGVIDKDDLIKGKCSIDEIPTTIEFTPNEIEYMKYKLNGNKPISKKKKIR